MIRTALTGIFASDPTPIVALPACAWTLSAAMALGRRCRVLSSCALHAAWCAPCGELSRVIDADERRRLDRQSELAHLGRMMQLGQMSAAIAHELRQPLTAIICSAQAGQRYLRSAEAGGPEVKEIIDDILQAGEHARAVIERLQAMSRQGPIQLRAVEINEIVTDTLVLLESDLALRQLRVILMLTDDLPRVRGDAVQLKQVVSNLVLNACDAMAQPGVETRSLLIQTSRDEHGLVLISVTDSGVGLSDDALATLFRPFHSSKLHGIGLGLAICRSIAETHSGEITGANNPGAPGATFTLKLPAAVEAEATGSSSSHETVSDHLHRG